MEATPACSRDGLIDEPEHRPSTHPSRVSSCHSVPPEKERERMTVQEQARGKHGGLLEKN